MRPYNRVRPHIILRPILSTVTFPRYFTSSIKLMFHLGEYISKFIVLCPQLNMIEKIYSSTGIFCLSRTMSLMSMIKYDPWHYIGIDVNLFTVCLAHYSSKGIQLHTNLQSAWVTSRNSTRLYKTIKKIHCIVQLQRELSPNLKY